jgi:hypothetical protein
MPVFLLGAMLGGMIGAGYIFANFVPRPETVVPVTPLAIAQYPWALNILVWGGIAYASAGVVLTFMAGFFESSAAASARSEALSALRSTFTAHEAPRPADVVRRIEDAVDVFRARCGGDGQTSRAKANHSASTEAPFHADDDEIPVWRRRDHAAKFVETDFQSVPERWRTDAYAKKNAREPAAKRGLKGLKKSAQD